MLILTIGKLSGQNPRKPVDIFFKRFALFILLGLITMNGFAQKNKSTIILMPSPNYIVQVDSIIPTPLFPKQANGKQLKQLARLYINNSGESIDAIVKITIGKQMPEKQEIGTLAKGRQVISILVPDITEPTPVVFEFITKDEKLLSNTKLNWQPQKKWTLYLTSYSHQDLGFGDYPHRIRTTVRHANINWPLKYCSETDAWPKSEQYRWNIESSEAIESYISFYGKEKANELAKRIREGRIALGQLHTTVKTESMNSELLARLFYTSRRIVPDLLDVPRNKTIMLDDVPGFSYSFPTYAISAGCDYLFHGYNFGTQGEKWPNGFITDTQTQTELGLGKSLYAPGREAACYFQGSDGQKILSLAIGYSIWGLQADFSDFKASDKPDPDRVELVMRGLLNHGWPGNLDFMLLQDAVDFMLATKKGANRVHGWNQLYDWPRMATVTMDQYFDILKNKVKQNEEYGEKIKVFAGDNNDQWIDQKAATARLFGQALRTNVALPASEKISTIAHSLYGGINSHKELQRAYSQLLQYHEHTDGLGWAETDNREGMRTYETELAEHREQVNNADIIQASVRNDAVKRLICLVTRPEGKNIMIFNSLSQMRTEVVKSKNINLNDNTRIVDATTGENVVWQKLPDGEIIFIAKNIPATGYRIYRLIEDGKSGKNTLSTITGNTIENEFYRLNINPHTGVVFGLYDKQLMRELVEQNAPYGFNEYLYKNANPGEVGVIAKWAKEFRLKQAEVSIIQGPLADVITIEGTAVGVEKLKQTIILYHTIKKIDFSLWVDKSPAPLDLREALFVALPLAVPNFSIHHGVPGAVVEPYRQQIEGSSTAHFGIQQFTDFSNSDFGVTIGLEDCGVVCYGEAQPSGDHNYNRSLEYPKNSRLYLYLMNNMFSVNIAREQRGVCEFHWSLRSHAGDWKSGNAAQFGESTVTPLILWCADGANVASLPMNESFMSVEAPNVSCTTIKPSELNGNGIILRFSENMGKATNTRISVPFLGNIKKVNETTLVEDDYGKSLPIIDKTSFVVSLPPFGVTTVRIICDSKDKLQAKSVKAQAVQDMQINLLWNSAGKNAAHYDIYRDTDSNCNPVPLNWVGQTDTNLFTDMPYSYPGGLRNTLEPETTYYYRVVPVDRNNNIGMPSLIAKATTLSTKVKNLPPLKVQSVVPILVSLRSPQFNFVNLMFRTAVESDITEYEIHRSTIQGFDISGSTLIGKVNSNDIIKGSEEYGHLPIDYPVKEFDHVMFEDKTVKPATTYYYKIRAVDTAGQKGVCSDEVVIKTKE
jgi:hypothetical protein